MTSKGPSKGAAPEPSAKRPFLGLTRKRRFRIYAGVAVACLAGFFLWAWTYLQPSRWYKYTDQVAFEQVARDVKLGHVVWEPAVPEPDTANVGQPTISPDGTLMIFSSVEEAGNANLFLRLWDGTRWLKPRPMRALNSAFHETAPALSPDGKFLYFASDRPGGRGGDDIWVAKWDGTEYAWPLPLTGSVNTPFDETDPSLAPDGGRLYYASNRPYVSEEEVIKAEALNGGEPLADVSDRKGNFDLYAADLAGDTPFDLITELQLSMLYSLRKGALADPEVMAKLGGSERTETAVDRGLAYLAESQADDGRWDLAKSGGTGGHDVAATSFALLAFYGRGERHDEECQYRQTVARGLEWLLAQQDRASGDLRGPNPQQNAMYDHGIASLAVVEAYGVTKDNALRTRAIAALEFITDSQHAEGGWRYQPGERGDLSVTGWYLMALASAKMSGLPVPEETLAGAVKFLRSVSGGEHGGSYGYTDPPGKRNSGRDGMNAVGYFCSLLVGASPNDATAFESARILNGSGVKDDDLYYLYYGTVAAYQNQGPLWRAWRDQMQPKLLRSQNKDGSWNARGNHGGQMGRAIGTALTVLCLEAHYRYTPLYGLGYEPGPDGPASGALDYALLPPSPHFRQGKYLEAYNSPADDTAPVVTDHGDFLYFASARDGGFGGSDIYRVRIGGAVTGTPANLGEEINSASNETDPALRMAGFEVVFNSDREGPSDALYRAGSRRIDRDYDYLKLPSFRWIFRNFHWLALFTGATTACVWLTRRALRPPNEEAPA